MAIEQIINNWQISSQLNKIQQPSEIEEILHLTYEKARTLSKEQLLRLKFVMASYNVYLTYEVGRCKSRMIYYQYRDKDKHEEYRLKYEMIRELPMSIAMYVKSIGDIINNG